MKDRFIRGSRTHPPDADPALDCRNPSGASDSTVYTGAFTRRWVGAQNHTTFLRNVSTADAGFQANRHARLLEEPTLALSRLQRQLARSDMPAEPHTEVREGIDLLNEQNDALPLPSSGLAPTLKVSAGPGRGSARAAVNS